MGEYLANKLSALSEVEGWFVYNGLNIYVYGGK